MQKGKERIHKDTVLTVYHQNFPKKQLGRHSHEEAHLFIPLEGSIDVEVEDINYKIASGQMMFIGGSVEHTFHAHGESGERLILQINKFKFKSKVSILPVHLLLKDMALNLISHSGESFAGSMSSLISEILLSTLNKQSRHASNELFITQQRILSSHHPQLRKILNLLESDLEITLDEVSKQSGISVRSLGRLTKEEVGLSPKELHTFYRIMKATELIFEGKFGLTAIAFECGYSSLSQFIENFKKWTGSKPSEFKPFQ